MCDGIALHICTSKALAQSESNFGANSAVMKGKNSLSVISKDTTKSIKLLMSLTVNVWFYISILRTSINKSEKYCLNTDRIELSAYIWLICVDSKSITFIFSVVSRYWLILTKYWQKLKNRPWLYFFFNKVVTLSIAL